jgi:hypothetical protein
MLAICQPSLSSSIARAVSSPPARPGGAAVSNSFIITNRQPELLIYEPLFKDQATGRPSGQAGWFSWSRTGSDLTTATACQYHTT